MLIICAGPETFLARQKARELTLAYQHKHDPSGLSIERLEHNTFVSDVLNKLSNLGFFASKKFLKYENLLVGINATQTKQLAKALVKDANQTIVLTYEDKKPTAKILDIIPKDLLFVYQFDQLSGQELNKWVTERCRSYGVSSTLSTKLIQLHNSDLWAIESSLQILQVLDEVSEINSTLETEDSIFAIIDLYIKQNPNWRDRTLSFDGPELLSPLLSQLVSWFKLKSGCTEGVHPYVQKKLATTAISEPIEKTLSSLQAFYASRNSLAQNQEILQML